MEGKTNLEKCLAVVVIYFGLLVTKRNQINILKGQFKHFRTFDI